MFWSYYKYCCRHTARDHTRLSCWLFVLQESEEQTKLEEVLKTPESTPRLDGTLPRSRRRIAGSQSTSCFWWWWWWCGVLNFKHGLFPLIFLILLKDMFTSFFFPQVRSQGNWHDDAADINLKVSNASSCNSEEVTSPPSPWSKQQEDLWFSKLVQKNAWDYLCLNE